MDENRTDIYTNKQIFDIAMKYADQLKGHIRLHSLYVYGSYAPVILLKIVILILQ
jgi:hypothetical protein